MGHKKGETNTPKRRKYIMANSSERRGGNRQKRRETSRRWQLSSEGEKSASRSERQEGGTVDDPAMEPVAVT